MDGTRGDHSLPPELNPLDLTVGEFRHAGNATQRTASGLGCKAGSVMSN